MITQTCESVRRKGNDRNFRTIRRFQEDCDGHYQCEETFRCTPREYRMNWKKSKAWCISKGKDADPCSITKGKNGKNIKHHEQCR